MLHTAAIIVVLHLEVGTILKLPHTPRLTQIHTQILDTHTVHQLVTATVAHSLNHSWRVVITFNQTRWRSSTRVPEERIKWTTTF